VYNTVRRLREPFQVAHELLLLYFREIEMAVVEMGVTIGNVFRRAGGDTLLAEARLNAAPFICPPVTSGSPSEVGRWNGRFNVSAKKPCVAYNYGDEHLATSLDALGCCKFNHVCMQWVSDKGPRGMCLGSHPMTECTYDPSKKLDKALA